jgi:PST family polysaccharide transporter
MSSKQLEKRDMTRKSHKHSGSMLAALGMQLVSKYSNVAVQLVVTMVLARLLTPEEFGTVAIVSVFTSFFSILADVGISTAIIQYKELTKKDCDALFLFCILLGIVLAGLFCLVSLPVSVIYADSQLVSLCCLASLSVMFNSANMAPNGVLLREHRFAAMSLRLVVASVASGALAIVLAVAGFGCYSLVWQTVASSAVILIWNWIATDLKLSNPHFVAPLKIIWRYSIYQAGFSTVNFFARNLDNLLVGGLMGSAQLGYYDKAYKLMGYPINYLTGIFSDVLQPYLSEYQDDKEKLYSSWLGICRVLALVGMFIGAIFVCFSREIVLLMYGDQWSFAAPVVATLGISVGMQMVNSTSGAIFQSAGRTDALFKSGLICTCISLVAILVGVASGSIAFLGLCVSIAYGLHLIVTSRLLVRRVLGISALSFLRSLLPSMTGMIGAIIAAYFAGLFMTSYGTLPCLLIRLAACVGMYVLAEWITGEWRAFLSFRDMKRMGVKE